MATNAKEINELNAAASVGSTDFIPLSQSGGTEAVKATVEQVSSAVADVLSDGALAELEYATSQGKNAIATALTNKGVATTASETLIQMADKVSNLNIDNTIETPITVLQCGELQSEWSSGYQIVQCSAKQYTAIAYSGTLYIHKWTASTDQTAKSLAELTASDASCSLNTALASSSSVRISGDGSKIAIFSPNTTDGLKVDVYDYVETSSTVSLLGTYNMSGYTSTGVPYSIGISNTGTVVFVVAYSKTGTTTSNTNNFYLYDLTTNQETPFTMELSCYTGSPTTSTTNYGVIYDDGSYIYILDLYNSRNINKLSYIKEETGNYTITQVGNLPGEIIPIAIIQGRCSIFPEKQLIFLWGTQLLNPPLGRFYSTTDPAEKNQVAVVDLNNMSVTSSDGLIISAVPVYSSYSGTSPIMSNNAAQCYYVEESFSGVFDIHMPTVGITYTYTRATGTLTHASTPLAIVYQNGTDGAASQSTLYAGNYPFWSYGLTNFYEDDNYIYLSYIGLDRISNTNSATKIGYNNEVYYCCIKYAKNQKSAYVESTGFKYMLQPHGIYSSNVNSGYYNRSTTITPAVPDSEN